MPETPATAKDEVSREEHRDATDSTLPYGGVVPDPACAKRNTPGRYSVAWHQEVPSSVCELLRQARLAWAIELQLTELTNTQFMHMKRLKSKDLTLTKSHFFWELA